MLEAIGSVAKDSKEEVPFYLFGIESFDGTIEFDEFVSIKGNSDDTSVVLDENMLSYLENRVIDEFNDGLVVCFGRSHAPVGKFYQNFYLGEFASYIQINEENDLFKNRKSTFLGCVVLDSGDVNFVVYDSRKNDFFRYTHAYIKDEVGTLTPVNTYGLKQGRIVPII